MTKAVVAAGLCSMLLMCSVMAVPAAAASNEKTYSYVATEKVNLSIDKDSLNLDVDQLAALIEQLPQDLQEKIAYLYMSADSISLNGVVHLNLKVWETKDGITVHLQFFWHGTIEILDGEGAVLLGIEAKNVQAVVHVDLPSGDLEGLEAFVNVHLNGVVCSDTCAFSIDLKAHLLLRWDDNGLTMFKVWLPDLSDLELV